MSVELGKLGLEIGHEKSDALHDWARDGTISYIHGMRYLGSGHPNPVAIAHVCRAARPGAFHSTQFTPSATCSYYQVGARVSDVM
jgi:hypothetical protein